MRAKRAFFQSGGVVTVDGGKPVAEFVHQAGADQPRVGVAELDHGGFDRRVLHHGAVIVEAHGGHVAAAVAGLLIALEQLKLLRRRARPHHEAFHRGVGAGDAAQRGSGLEGGDGDADRDAGLAGGTDRSIGDVMAAPEARAGQPVVQRPHPWAGDLGHDLTLRPAGHIGAGQRRGGVEELRAAGGFEIHGNVPPCMFQGTERGVNQDSRRAGEIALRQELRGAGPLAPPLDRTLHEPRKADRSRASHTRLRAIA